MPFFFFFCDGFPQDFKVVIGVSEPKFGAFMEADNGEKEFLAAVGSKGGGLGTEAA